MPRGAALALIAASAALALLPASAPAAQWIGIPSSVAISEPAVATAAQAVAVNASGAEVLTWVAGKSLIATVRAPGGGPYATPVTINSPGAFSGVYSSPNVAIDPAGDVLVAWSESDGAGHYDVHVAAAGPGQVPTPGAAVPGTSTATQKWSPKAMFFADGTALVAWAPYGEALEYTLRSPGGSFGAPVALPGAIKVQDLAVSPDAGDRALVSWVEATSETHRALLLADLSTAGAVTGTQTIDETSSPRNPTCEASSSCDDVGIASPRLATDPTGDGLIAYEEVTNEGSLHFFSTTVVKAAYRTAGSGFQATPTSFTPSVPTFIYEAPGLDAAMLSDGSALVSWDQGSLGRSIQYAERGRSTPFATAAKALTEETASDSYSRPSVAAAGGIALVAFVHNQEVLAQSVSGGALQGPPTILSAADRTVSAPRLAGDGAGDAVAVWGRYDASGNSLVESAAYDTGPRLSGLAVPASGITGALLSFGVTAVDPLSPVAVDWTFGDGAQATGASVTHAYAKAGAQTTSVVATDAAGLSTVALSGVTQVTPAGFDNPGPCAGGKCVGLRISLKIAKQHLRDVLRRGLAVTIGCSGPCKVGLALRVSGGIARTAKHSSKSKRKAVTVGRRGVTLKAAGTKTVHVALMKAAKRRLRHARRLTLSVVETVRGAGPPKSLTRQVTLR